MRTWDWKHTKECIYTVRFSTVLTFVDTSVNWPATAITSITRTTLHLQGSKTTNSMRVLLSSHSLLFSAVLMSYLGMVEIQTKPGPNSPTVCCIETFDKIRFFLQNQQRSDDILYKYHLRHVCISCRCCSKGGSRHWHWCC